MKTKIEWTDYTLNPVKGLCPVGCFYCYARRMYKRFHWEPTVRYIYGWEDELDKISKPSRIFVGSTMELFGDWIMPVWIQDIIQVAGANPQHTFIFLTKCPQNLPRQFPDNCWVGVSATNAEMLYDALDNLCKIKTTVRFISFEPLLERVNGGECDDTYRLGGLQEAGINWVLIGQQTPISNDHLIRREWVDEIIQAADYADIPVFLKNNLKTLLPFRQHYRADYHDKTYQLRQEFPKVVSQ